TAAEARHSRAKSGGRGETSPYRRRRRGTTDKSPNRRLGEGTAAGGGHSRAKSGGRGKRLRTAAGGGEPRTSPPTRGWGKVPPPEAAWPPSSGVACRNEHQREIGGRRSHGRRGVGLAGVGRAP